MREKRFDRSIRFFGKEGQNRLAETHVAVVGIGGLGTHVVQQVALLGVGHLTLIDKEEIEISNLNRYIGTRHSDPIPGTPKVAIGERMVNEINPDIRVDPIPFSLITEKAFDAIIKADYVFGCLDREGLRLILNELCSAYCKPYFDLASEIIPGNPPTYGGRVCVAKNGEGCLFCLGEIDVAEAQADLSPSEERLNRKAIYGIAQDVLDQVGPSVVSINGVVASLAVTEFMVDVAGIRAPKKLCVYRANMGRVSIPDKDPVSDCYYCKEIRGLRDGANLQRYITACIDI